MKIQPGKPALDYAMFLLSREVCSLMEETVCHSLSSRNTLRVLPVSGSWPKSDV